ncbi:MAG: glycosyltransferase, partial [Alphaproteobacteria bacterium]|nr:glycosyltransferase [Alphaproteobacteria bacterium]
MIKQKKYAIIYTWPGGCQNAESEVIRHMLIAAKNMNITMDIVSKDGFILDDSFKKTNQKIHESEYEFMITMHYEDSKLLDAFYYHTLWNPPCIPLQYASYPDILKNIISNDDFLIYDDGGISQHLKAMLIDTPRNLDNASSLTASFPATMAMEPKLENPTLFYCGINWEKMIGTTTRHEELFKLLDRLENVKIYGPQKTWVGHKSYCGTIPFDGFSLVEEAHKCGVVLALSSDFHYRAGAATNRVYEGCAAGAIVISDTNRFIKKHFGDSILYIDFDKANPQHMCEQIKAHLDWIKNNKDDALKLAKKSQNIFLEKFTLEKQLTDIIANHENRKKAVADMLYAKNEKSVTLATLFLDSLTFGEHEQELLNNSIHNIERQ